MTSKNKLVVTEGQDGFGVSVLKRDDVGQIGHCVRFAESQGMDLGLPIEARLRLAKQEITVGSQAYLRAGIWMLSVKRDVGHGEFGEALEALGLNERTARRWMEQALFFCALPESERSKIFSLSGNKILALAHANFEDAQALVEGKNSNELSASSVAMLNHELEQIRQKNSNLEHVLTETQAKLKAATDKQIGVLARKRNLPEHVERLQDECAFSVKKMQLCLGTIDSQALVAEQMGDAYGEGCRRHVVAALQQLHLQVRDALGHWSGEFDIAADDTTVEALATVDIHRLDELRQIYEHLTGGHVNAVHNLAVDREKRLGREGKKGAGLKARAALPVDA